MKIDGAAVSGGLTFPGEVRARYESRLGFRLGGKLVERRVDVGAVVKRGQVLARLDAQDASLNAAQAEANRALAEAEAKRYRELREKNFVSQAVLDAKETALKTAAAQAGVARNQAGYTTLVADRDGVVTAVEAEAGQVVAAGQTVLRVAEGNEKEIVIAVPEGDVEKVRGAEGFAVSLNSLPGRSWTGRLRELSPSADAATRTFTARIGVAQADEAVRLGMSARVEAKVGLRDTALRLPLSAFFTRNDQANVWVVDPATQTVKLTRSRPTASAATRCASRPACSRASWWSPPAPTCSRTARKCACRESRRPLQSHRGGAAPSRADPVLHPGDRHRRRLLVFQARPARGPGFHLPRHGHSHDVAGRHGGAGGQAGHRPPREEAAGDPLLPPHPQLLQVRRVADHPRTARHGARRGGSRCLVPGAQEDRRHPPHPAGGRRRAVLQRRVRRRLRLDLRLHRRRLQPFRTARPCRGGAPAPAEAEERRQDRPGRRPGRPHLRRAVDAEAGGTGPRRPADRPGPRHAERRGAGRRGEFADAHHPLARHRRAELGGGGGRHPRGGGRPQPAHRRHRPGLARLRRSADLEDVLPRPAGHRPGRLHGEGRRRAQAGRGSHRRDGAHRGRPADRHRVRPGVEPAAHRQAGGGRLHARFPGGIGHRAAGELRQPRPAHRPGGGHHHPLGGGGDLPRHALLRHRPAPHLHRRADHRAGPAGGRRHDRGGDDVAQDRAGPRQARRRRLRLAQHRLPDAHRHADHRRRLPADRHGQVRHRRIHLRHLRRGDAGAADLLGRRRRRHALHRQPDPQGAAATSTPSPATTSSTRASTTACAASSNGAWPTAS
jgi:multidrug efflux system membrane fusion protein